MSFDPVKLSDICSMRTGKLDSNAAVPGGEYPFFTCAQETYQIDKYAFDTEAVLLGGNNANGIFPLKYYTGKFNAYQRTYLLESLDRNRLATRYLYYALRPALGRFQSASIGATTQYLTKGILDSFVIKIPNLATQNDIVTILSNYDDLIENNRRRIALLEQSAQLLYKEWFVRLRFPGHEHTKIVNGVPEGWTKGVVSDFGEIITGKTPSTKKAENFGHDIPFVKTPDMHRSRIIVETEESLSEIGAATQPKKTLPVGTILVACIGAKLGVVSLTNSPCQTNQQINAIVPDEDYIRHYILFVAIDLKPKLEALGGGATMPNVNKTKFGSIPVTIPSLHLLKEFEEYCKQVSRQMKLLIEQNICLSKARDLLLPRFMNGELTV